MTIKGHLRVGIAWGLALLLSSFLFGHNFSNQEVILLSLLVAAGSLAPDFLEFGIIPHRTYTHYPLLWLSILSVCYFGTITPISDIVVISDFMTAYMLIAFSCGAMLHIACDWPYYSGIPLWSPTRKIPLFGLTFDGPLNTPHEYLWMCTPFLILGLEYFL